MRDLRGKKIGVNRAGSKPWLILQVLLQDAGLEPGKDLTVLQMGGGSQERVAALMRGGRCKSAWTNFPSYGNSTRSMARPAYWINLS